jgi:hypothetical protein
MHPLSEMDDSPAIVERISEELELDDELMGFLDRAGLRPGEEVAVVGRSPQGTLTIKVAGGDSFGVGDFVAERVFVAAAR